MRSGVRCAETIRASWPTPNASSMCAAACMVPQSDWLPMMMPMEGRAVFLDLLRFAMGLGGSLSKRRSIGSKNRKESADLSLVNHS